MKTYTASQLQKEIGIVLAEVQESGQAIITSRNRPTMILIKQSDLDKLGDAHKQLEIE